MSEWGITQLSDIASLMTDGNWIESKDQSPSGIRLLQVGNIGKGYYIDKADKAKYISAETFLRLKCTEVFADDVLISRLPDPIGRACIIPKLNSKAITAVDCTIIRILDDKCNKRYLLHFLSSSQYFRQIEKFAVGSTRSRISRTNLKSITLPLPPLPIQQKIAAILDKVNDLITERKQQLEKIDIMVKSRFVEMFGDPVENPMGWENPLIEETISNGKNALKAGPFGSSLKKEYYVKQGYKIYGQEQVISGDAYFGNYYISDEKYKELQSCAVQANDVLISLVGTYGKVLIIPNDYEPGVINPRLMKITFDPNKVNTIYFKHFFASKSLIEKLADKSRGGTMDILNLGIVRKLQLPLPPLSLQNRFADFVRAADKSKFAIEFAANKAHPLQIIAKEQ